MRHPRVKTILGSRQRRKYRPQKGKEPWAVVVENPTYDLTVFKVQANKLTLKIYTKGERVLRAEAAWINRCRLARIWPSPQGPFSN